MQELHQLSGRTWTKVHSSTWSGFWRLISMVHLFVAPLFVARHQVTCSRADRQLLSARIGCGYLDLTRRAAVVTGHRDVSNRVARANVGGDLFANAHQLRGFLRQVSLSAGHR